MIKYTVLIINRWVTKIHPFYTVPFPRLISVSGVGKVIDFTYSVCKINMFIQAMK